MRPFRTIMFEGEPIHDRYGRIVGRNFPNGSKIRYLDRPDGTTLITEFFGEKYVGQFPSKQLAGMAAQRLYRKKELEQGKANDD